MKVFNTIKQLIASLDKKQFYYVLSGVLVGILCLMAFIMYYQSSRVDYWKKRIRDANEYREGVKAIIAKDLSVSSQRDEVDKMLNENPDFKIDGYFAELLTKFKLIDGHATQRTVSYADRGDSKYREVLLNAKFDTMNMRQLCELLDAVEQNKRIYTKELEIIKSKKVPNTIDVNLTIATLQAKPETTEVAE
jgi:hypothetical protein